MMTFEEACKNADRQLDAGENTFIVASRILGFYVANDATDVGDDKVVVYFNGRVGRWRSFDLCGSAVCGSA